MGKFSNLFPSERLLVVTRVAGHYILALICLIFPEAGENRFALAALLAFVIAPIALLILLRFSHNTYEWQDLLVDLLSVLLFGFLMPEQWMTILLVAMVVAMAPSISVQERSLYKYAAAYGIAVSGMMLAAIVNDVEGWVLPISVLAALFPIIMFYSRWQMVKADGLRSSAKERETLMLVAGRVAHDFNNILTGIVGYSDLALRYLDDNEPARDSVRRVMEASNSAALLARQLLTISGREVSQKVPLDLGSELEQILPIAESVAPAGVSVRLSVNPDTPQVEGDSGLLQQVFLNIIVNAIEASTAPNGVFIDVHGEAPGKVVVGIRDQGCGIEADKIEEIFDPFYTSKSKGHGLGLAAVQRILDQHGASIGVSSTVGQGTDMVMVFDAVVSNAAVASGRGTGSASASINTILVADDESRIRQLLHEVLTALGYDVLEASDGNECLARFSAHQDKLLMVILDLKMPGPDGRQCLTHIRKCAADLPVLIVSGYDPGGRIEAGMDPHLGVLRKPFRTMELEQAVTNLLSA